MKTTRFHYIGNGGEWFCEPWDSEPGEYVPAYPVQRLLGAAERLLYVIDEQLESMELEENHSEELDTLRRAVAELRGEPAWQGEGEP